MLSRVRRRYIAIKIDSNETFTSKELKDSIWVALLKLYGEYGASKANINLIYFDEQKKMAILRTNHNSLKIVRTAIASITKIGDKPAAVHVLLVSGTIKTLHKKLKLPR